MLKANKRTGIYLTGNCRDSLTSKVANSPLRFCLFNHQYCITYISQPLNHGIITAIEYRTFSLINRRWAHDALELHMMIDLFNAQRWVAK
jgi:hypothetical protein